MMYKITNINNYKFKKFINKRLIPIAASFAVASSVALIHVSNTNNYDKYNESSNTEVSYEDKYASREYQDYIDIPEIYKFDIFYAMGKSDRRDELIKYRKISRGDLEDLQSLTLEIKDNSSLDFLKYCKLDSITFNLSTKDLKAFDSLPDLSDITSLKFEGNEQLFSRKLSNILNSKLPNLKCLDVYNMLFEPGAVESMKTIDNLIIAVANNCDINCEKLTHLKNLTINSGSPYDLAIYFNGKEYETLRNSGVNVHFTSYTIKDKFFEIDKMLYDIIDKLGITEDSTDKEKLDAVLIYLLKNYKYDEEVAYLSDNGIEHDDLTASFYEDGFLYAALKDDEKEDEKSIICGNYASFFEALFDRLSLPSKSYMATSENHAWNIVNIDGTIYCVDATWLDQYDVEYENKIYTSYEAIENGWGSKLPYYMDKVDEKTLNQEIDSDHYISNYPEYMMPDYIPEEISYIAPKVNTQSVRVVNDLEDVSDDKVKLTINGIKNIIDMRTLIGIMFALGCAYKLKSENKKELNVKLR